MDPAVISLRTFIGSKDFAGSRSFYTALGFQETIISPKMSVFQFGQAAFYLQDAYVEDWLNNTMLFIEVNDVSSWFEHLTTLALDKQYPGVKLMPIRKEYWGEECFMLDPSGALLHFGQFYAVDV